MVQLSLLAYPKDPKGHKAHDVHHELGQERQERMPQVSLAVNLFDRGSAQIEHKERHRHGKDAGRSGPPAVRRFGWRVDYRTSS